MDGKNLTEAEVFSAFKVLFSFGSEVNRNTLETIQITDVKRAYRKRALDTHPDRFAGSDENLQKACSRRFIEISEAYTTLNSYLKLREEKGFRLWQQDVRKPAYSWDGPPFHGKRPRTARQYKPTYGDNGYSSFFWHKGPPHRSLRIGEYLFYSGVIPWNLLIKAIVWQRAQRPRIGEIAQRWRWLTETQINFLLKHKRPGERLGETLLRYSIINSFQLRLLLAHQQRVQKPFGSFFVYNGHLSEAQIQQYLQKQRLHNLKYDPETARPFKY